MKFEDLLPPGKRLHDLTEDEIQDVISKCSREELARVESTARKSIRKTKSVKSLEVQRRKEEEMNDILLRGLHK
jgi:vacuolar-type H+-ATPase subunit C/Vma6